MSNKEIMATIMLMAATLGLSASELTKGYQQFIHDIHKEAKL